MEDVQHIFIILVILNFVQGISCDDGDLYGLITASTIAGVLLCLLIILAVKFAVWPEYHRASQLKKGKVKVPRSWLDYEKEAKQRIKQQLKYQMKQKRSQMIKQNGVNDMEMQYMHRSRPEIPGSWRREVRHSKGYIVTEVPTLQRTVLGDNQQLRPVSGNDHAVWHQRQSPTGLRYSDIANASTEIRISPPCDIESSSLSSTDSADSTLKVSDTIRFKREQKKDEEEIEATLELENEDDGSIFVDGNEVQERATAF